MKNINPDEGVRRGLILAALDELLEHGVTDFSLRRVATAAQVSCAAPYRHFKSKEELIAETARYITSKWSLLAAQIVSAHGADPERTLTELSVAALKFWVANGNFRSLLLPGAESPLGEEMKKFDSPILRYSDLVADAAGLTAPEREARRSFILSVIYGGVVLAGSGKLSPEDAATAVREEICAIIRYSKF